MFWISQEMGLEQRRDLVEKLAEYVKDHDFPGVSGEPETAQLFAESFCEFHEKISHTYMMLEAYHCPVVKKPVNVGEFLRLMIADLWQASQRMLLAEMFNLKRCCQSQLLHEEVSPMLYAYAKNPVSNKVYQSIGFVEADRIADIKFDLRP